MMRKEYKYVVPAWQYEDLRRAVRPWLVADKFACCKPEARYTVRSIYFDTHRLQAYHDKLAGVSERQKFRIRAYDGYSTGCTVFLELKRRFDQSGDKVRTPVAFADLPPLFDAVRVAHSPAGQRVPSGAANGVQPYLFHILRESLMPVALVTYEREAYQGRFQRGLRVTLDSGVRFRSFPALQDLFDEEGLRRVSSSFWVLEVKFDRGFPSWLQRILERYDLTRRSFSKYAFCVEASARLRSHIRQLTTASRPIATRMEVVS